MSDHFEGEHSIQKQPGEKASDREVWTPVQLEIPLKDIINSSSWQVRVLLVTPDSWDKQWAS